MKKLLFVLLVGFLTVQATAQTTEQKDISKILSFKNDNYDFGKIPFGKPVEYDVEIKNISNEEVKIENVQVSCGCTTPQWKPGPYAAGDTFKIRLGFNGQTMGAFEKVVTIYFSGGMVKVVKFKGETFNQ